MMITPSLQFYDIPGYEGVYAASRCGRVYSHKFAQVMQQQLLRNGYMSVMLRTPIGTSVRLSVHHLVAITFIGPRPDGFEVDHKNRIKTDNCADNLRYVRRGFNMHNVGLKARHAKTSSRFKGVAFHGKEKSNKPWLAKISYDKKHHFLGAFPTQRLAAEAYDRAAIARYGDMASTNKSLGLL